MCAEAAAEGAKRFLHVLCTYSQAAVTEQLPKMARVTGRSLVALAFDHTRSATQPSSSLSPARSPSPTHMAITCNTVFWLSGFSGVVLPAIPAVAIACTAYRMIEAVNTIEVVVGYKHATDDKYDYDALFGFSWLYYYVIMPCICGEVFNRSYNAFAVLGGYLLGVICYIMAYLQGFKPSKVHAFTPLNESTYRTITKDLYAFSPPMYWTVVLKIRQLPRLEGGDMNGPPMPWLPPHVSAVEMVADAPPVADASMGRPVPIPPAALPADPPADPPAAPPPIPPRAPAAAVPAARKASTLRRPAVSPKRA